MLIIFVGIIAFSNLVLLLAIAFLALAAKKFLDTSATPMMAEVKETVNKVNEMVDRIEDKADHIMTIGEDTAQKVSTSVVTASDMVEKSVKEPLVTVSSVIAGIAKAVETWRKAS
jgi:nucleoside diphosphate kinase